MFLTKRRPSKEEYKYLVKTAIVLTACNYARIKVSPIISSGKIDVLADYFVANFLDSKIKGSKKLLRKFIFNAARIIDKPLGVGFSLFCINLIIKKMCFLFVSNFKKIIDMPLNRKELQKVNSVISKMSDLNYGNYTKVMDDAESFALANGFDSLFEWELKEYNK